MMLDEAISYWHGTDHRVPEGHKFYAGRPMRTFEGGATRDDDTDKFDFEGFLSPVALQHFAAYMHRHRVQADGQLRDSDNWQRGSGIPLDAYMKSAWRHFFDWWACHRGYPSAANETMEEALCALIFNAMGYLHTICEAKERG